MLPVTCSTLAIASAKQKNARSQGCLSTTDRLSDHRQGIGFFFTKTSTFLVGVMFTCAKYAYAACLCWVCILWRNVCGSWHVVFPSITAACVSDACQDAAAVDASRQPVLFSSALCSRAPNTRMQLVCAGFVSCGVMFVAPGMLFFFQSLLRVFETYQDAAAVDASRQPVLFSSPFRTVEIMGIIVKTLPHIHFYKCATF